MKRKTERLFSALLLAALLLCIPLAVKSAQETGRDQEQGIVKIREMIEESGAILHAGGFISDVNGEEHKYTNSVEAMENALSEGDRIIEIDVVQTTDGEMVCLHKWKDLYKPSGKKYKQAVSFEKFSKGTVAGYFTPMTVEMLAQYMRDHPDLYIVLDVKTPKRWIYSKIAAYYPDLLDRMIAQIYHLTDYDMIHDMGFSYLILTLYTANEDELVPEKLKQFAEENEVVGITMPKRFRNEEWEPVYTALKETGLPLYIHTIDGEKNREKMLAEGFSAVYTNDVKDVRDNPSAVTSAGTIEIPDEESGEETENLPGEKSGEETEDLPGEKSGEETEDLSD